MLTLDTQTLTVNDVARVACSHEFVALGSRARQKTIKTYAALQRSINNQELIYGVTTGFGALKDVFIEPSKTNQLQLNLIISHAVAVGQPLSKERVRGMMLLMANYLSKGFSGVRADLPELLIGMLNNDIYPVVPEKGSVGSSGDLAPAAHIALVMIGKGEVISDKKRIPGLDALRAADLNPLTLQAKEGLALTNNTACMTSIAAITLHKTQKLIELADVCGALSAEALRANAQAFDIDIHRIKPHKGQLQVAQHLSELLESSTMVSKDRLQDQYSIRCIPQIHGGIREAIAYVKEIVSTEVNSVTDNPLIFIDPKSDELKIVSGGNFHGEPVAIAMDTLAIALSEIANTSDRRVASMLDTATNYNLPAFLALDSGLNSGMMVLQYTTASLVSENKTLAHPASVDSIPTSANVEDLVSMGTFGARKTSMILDNVAHVLAIELMVACQAIDFRIRDGLHLGSGTSKMYQQVRNIVPFFEKDTVYYPYIEYLVDFIWQQDYKK